MFLIPCSYTLMFIHTSAFESVQVFPNASIVLFADSSFFSRSKVLSHAQSTAGKISPRGERPPISNRKRVP